MDLLQLAQLRFQELVPNITGAMTVETSDAVEAWLREQVCAVVAQLGTVQRFRGFACWSPDRLSQDRDTPERKLVEATDRSLISAAKKTAKAAHDLGMVQAGASDAKKDPVIDWLATRPWFDLACPEEFFTGGRGLHLKTSRPDCHWEFWRGIDPRVPLGDYVCRGMLMRTEYFARKTDEVWQACFRKCQQQGQGAYSLARDLFGAKMELDQAMVELRQACHRGCEAGLRNACTALVLVYAAYSPNPGLEWLGFPAGSAAGNAPLIRQVIRPPSEVVTMHPLGSHLQAVERCRAQLCRRDVIEGIASALATVGEVYYRRAETEDLLDWLRQDKQLVMVDRRPRVIYWRGESVGKNWDRCSTRWDLLWKLAERAQRRQAVHHEELTHRTERSSTVKNRRSRLSEDIPGSLDALIEDVRPGGYRLNLAPEQIGLLSLDHDEQLVEVGPAVKPRTPPRFPWQE